VRGHKSGEGWRRSRWRAIESIIWNKGAELEADQERSRRGGERVGVEDTSASRATRLGNVLRNLYQVW
jgi:hypothetical protein